MEQADLEVHSHDGGQQSARQQDDGGQGQHGHDLVCFVTAAGDEDIEGADDRFSGVAGLLQDGLIAGVQRLEPLSGSLVAERL